MTYKSLLAGLLASACLAGAASAACEITLRSSDTHPDGYPTVEGVKAMGRILSDKTGGRICVEVYHSAQLGQEAETIEQTQFGVLDLNRVSMGPFNNIVPETQVPSLPYIFRSTEHMHKVMDGEIGQEILDAFGAHQLVGLAFYDAGSRSFYNRTRPITSMADLKGLKFRVIQSDLFVAMVDALGAAATPMPYGEVYSSIQTGVIDGAENNWPSYDSSGHYEVAKYFTLDQHLMVPEVLVMSEMSWNRLSPEDQQAVREAAAESVAIQRQLWLEAEQASEAKVRAAGSEIISDIDKAPFIAAMEPVYARFVTDEKLKSMVARIQATE